MLHIGLPTSESIPGAVALAMLSGTLFLGSCGSQGDLVIGSPSPGAPDSAADEGGGGSVGDDAPGDDSSFTDDSVE
jgi:hypothetical protein